MTTTIVPLILVMLWKGANMKLLFATITMHAPLITAVPVLDAFSFLMLLVTITQLVKLALVMPKKDVSTQMTQTVAMEKVYVIPMHAMTRLVAPLHPSTVMTIMSVPLTLAMTMKVV